MPKTNVIADKYRTDGNKLYGQHKWLDALCKYNKSLCYAELGSESMSIAYANRANCFFRLNKFDECLVDIELAKKSNYPERLMSKLDQRKAACLVEQSKTVKLNAKVPKLSYPPKVTIPHMADCLEIRQNDEFGRHIVAKCDIPVGKTVLIEPFFSGIEIGYEYNRCVQCPLAQLNLLPCDKCTTAMFCSTDCSEHGRTCHDTMECGYNLFNDGGHMTQLIAPTIYLALEACGSVEKLMVFVGLVRSQGACIPTTMIEPMERYRAFLQFSFGYLSEDFANILSEADCSYRLFVDLPKIARLFDTIAKQRFLQHLIVEHIMIVRKIENRNVVKHSFSLTSALFNHQCTPNVFILSLRGKTVCVTNRPIRSGEQLFVAYVPMLPMLPMLQRESLYENYGFWCKCTKCVPIALGPHHRQAIGDDESFQFLTMYHYSTMTFGEFSGAIVKKHCIDFLTKFGHIPHNTFTEYVTQTFIRSIAYEYAGPTNQLFFFD